MHGGSLVGETKWSVEKCPWRHVENPSCLCWFTPDLSPGIFPSSTHPLPPTHSSAHLPTQLLIQLSFAHPASEQFPMPTMCRPPAPSAANKTMQQHLLRCSAWCLEAEGPLRITLVASASVGCGREWRRHVWCALQSPEQGGGGGKELRAALARWLHSSPWRKWGLHAVRRYTRTVFPVGWQGHLESKDYSLLMCEEKKKALFFFLPFSDIVKG